MKHSLESSIIWLMLQVRRVGAKISSRLWLLQRLLSSLLPATDIDATNPVFLSNGDNDADLAPLLRNLPTEKPKGSSLYDNDLSRKDDYDLEIIIPAYNVEQYIDQCLLSVFNQRSKYKCLLMVINDGSTDGTRQRIAKYEHYPDIEIIDQKNAGLAAARNIALRHIRGRYVTFVDSDDWLLPGAIDMLMDTVTKYDADIVEGCFRVFNSGHFYPGYSHPFELSNRWTGQLQGYACGKVLRAGLFSHFHFPEGYLFEDTLMTLMLFPHCHRNPQHLLYPLFPALPFRQSSCLRHLLPSATSVLPSLHNVRPTPATLGTRSAHQRLPCLHACDNDKTLTH